MDSETAARTSLKGSTVRKHARSHRAVEIGQQLTADRPEHAVERIAGNRATVKGR